MDDLRLFLDAIAADPADEFRRLVFADWLEDRDDFRGALLRRALTDFGDDDSFTADLDRLRAVAGPLACRGAEVRTNCGFVDEIATTVFLLGRSENWPFRNYPIRSLDLQVDTADDGRHALGELGGLADLREIRLTANEWTAPAWPHPRQVHRVVAVLTHPALTARRWTFGRIAAPWVTALLAEAPHFPAGLSELALDTPIELSESTVWVIADRSPAAGAVLRVVGGSGPMAWTTADCEGLIERLPRTVRRLRLYPELGRISLADIAADLREGIADPRIRGVLHASQCRLWNVAREAIEFFTAAEREWAEGGRTLDWRSPQPHRRDNWRNDYDPIVRRFGEASCRESPAIEVSLPTDREEAEAFGFRSRAGLPSKQRNREIHRGRFRNPSRRGD